MPISRKDEWMQIAELDEGDHIRFTAEFGDIMGELGWEAKAFVGHLLGLWYDPFEHLLDYTSGEAKLTQDQPGEGACRFSRPSGTGGSSGGCPSDKSLGYRQASLRDEEKSRDRLSTSLRNISYNHASRFPVLTPGLFGPGQQGRGTRELATAKEMIERMGHHRRDKEVAELERMLRTGLPSGSL